MKKETYYFVRTPEYKLSDYWTEREKTEFFSDLDDATRFIKKQINRVKKSKKGIMFIGDESNAKLLKHLERFKTEALKKLSLVKPIPFEVDVPEYI